MKTLISLFLSKGGVFFYSTHTSTKMIIEIRVERVMVAVRILKLVVSWRR
jgi:hypothetical protein